VDPALADRVLAEARAAGVPAARIGHVGEWDGVVTARVAGTAVDLPVSDLRRLYLEAIPSRMRLAATAED
jgi:hypothetical protein